MQRSPGFTLIELIACIVILGLIGIGATTIITLGARSFFTARQADDASVSAQIALERIALELRDVKGGIGTGGAAQVLAGPPPRIRYITAQPTLPGTRTLSYYSGNSTLALDVNGTENTLATGVSACTMTFSGTGQSATFTVTLTMQGAGTFTITVKPRSNAVTPVTS
jgi:prepilin-type N-terminal cleavage/methylation domain-containing protein